MPACRRAKLNMHTLQIEYQLRNLLLELQIFAQVDTVLGANLHHLAVLSQTSQLLFSTLLKQTGFHTKMYVGLIIRLESSTLNLLICVTS